MSGPNIPINKGNYSMDSPERESRFETLRGEAWPEGYAQYRRNWIEFPKLKHVSDYPLLVDTELASVCNLRCPMCYTISPQFKEKVRVTLMDFNLYRRIVDEIGGHVPALRLSLRGEATLHPRFVECISYAKQRGIREVSTLTHGGRLTRDFFHRIVEAGIDWITLSIDGIGPTYESIRKPIKFAEILQIVKDIKAYKEERGLHRPVIKIQGVWPAIRENPQAYYDAFKEHVDLIAFNPLIDYLGKDEDLQYVEDFSCPQQYQRLVIGADGLVMKCSNDEENQEVIGDARVETVHQIWHGEKMNRVREMHNQRDGFLQSPVCRRCYLPRRTRDETATVDGREITIPNYVNRNQKIGE
jgi:radical SAM protein with 4Fe4S-binding SPASM domain